MKKKKLSISIIILIVIIGLTLFLVSPVKNNINYGLDLKGGFEVLYLVENLDKDKKVSNSDLTSTYKAIQNRINTLGVSEPEITIEGDKIRVKLPGVTNEDEARERLSTPAVLTFRNTSNEELMNASVLKSPGASLDFDKTNGKPVVALSIKDNDTFYKVTKQISESEDQTIVIWLDFTQGVDSFSPFTCKGEDSRCISYATVSEGFANNVVIQGNFTEEEANLLIDFINSGSLPTKLTEISTKTVDAAFGTDTLKLIAIAGLITLAVIMSIMIIFYGISGLISGICLCLYLVLVFVIFNLIDGVLTLPGIAALILGIGMAVDSSIITFEKIKEEVANGKTLEKGYLSGNKRSLISLIDANLTTFIAALVLFIFGESSVKGFATMLILTIIVTMITMVFVSRIIMKNLINSKVFDKKERILLGKIKKVKTKNYLKCSKYNIGLICAVVLSGIVFLLTSGLNLGIDFKGGSSITIKSEEKVSLKNIENDLKDYKIVDKTLVSENEAYVKIEDTLKESEIKELKNNLEDKGYKSDISVISTVVKKDLTKNAIKSLIYASIAILIYIAIRFTTNFAISSIIAILSDVLVTISLFAIFRLEINFIFVAGILTIIGYSINDTIIVFDLIRDKLTNLKTINEDALTNTVKECISLSFKRNILTSITTLSAVVVLLLMGISSIREFNLTVLFGLFAGTFSSLLLAPYIWLKLEIRSLKNPKKEDNETEDGPEEKLIKGINI